jgi:16S rRNA processing protein RimM
MKDRLDTYVVVGEILRPHGVKGELVVRSFADSAALFCKGRSLRLAPPGAAPGQGAARRVVASRLHGERLLVTLADVPDRTAAETLRGHLLSVPSRELPELSDDEVYRHQLIGCRVVAPDTPHPELGVLDDILDMPGQEVWRILHPSGREILYPANPHTVADIDLDAALITVVPPPGLVDIYLDPAAPGDAPDAAP